MMKLFHQSLESTFYRYRIRLKKIETAPLLQSMPAMATPTYVARIQVSTCPWANTFSADKKNRQKSEMHPIVKWDINGITNEKWIEMVQLNGPEMGYQWYNE